MYDAPQCKVLIAGQSYMKCRELKRMLNWAEEGFRVMCRMLRRRPPSRTS